MAAALATAVQSPQNQPEDDDSGRMSFLEHLEELRIRIIRACLAVGLGMAVAFLFIERIVSFVLGPTLRVLPPGSKLVFTRPGEAFSFYVDVALIAGAVFAAPLVMYQVWRFIAPGLYAKEKKYAIPFVLLTTIGTVAGALFSHFVLFPAMIAFFGTFESAKLQFMARLEDVFDLYLRMLLGMVAVFQIPTLTFFLARMRVVTARLLWRHMKYAILVMFIAAAILTPSADPWNQAALAAPMIGLYILSIGIAWVVAPRDDQSRSRETSDTKIVFIAAWLLQRHTARQGTSERE